MKSKLLFLVLCLTASIGVNAQGSAIPIVETMAKKSVEKSEVGNDPLEKKGDPATPTVSENSDKTDQSSNQTQTQTYVRPNARKRFTRYLDNTIGPTAFIGPAFGASINTASNNPPEWGKTGKGFGRRFASEFGKNVIQETTTYALDEAFKLDSSYYRSTKSGFGPRLRHAVVSSFTSRNKDGKAVFGFPRIAGIYASELIANETWYPNRFSAKDGFREGSISIGTNVIVNIFREFVFK